MKNPSRKAISDRFRDIADVLSYPENLKDLKNGLSDLFRAVEHMARQIEALEDRVNDDVAKDIENIARNERQMLATISELKSKIVRLETIISMHPAIASESARLVVDANAIHEDGNRGRDAE